MNLGVPVVDVSALLREGAAASSSAPAVSAIDGACREWGFFQIVGHGISAERTERFEAALRSFFALPASAKAAVRRSAGNAWGYYDRELTKNVQDWKEIFDFGDRDEEGVDGRNRWPDLPGFREVVEDWFRVCEPVSLRLLEALCVALGLPPDRLSGHFVGRHSSFLRLNHYPRCDDPARSVAALRPSSGRLGVGHHTDAGALTVLHQDASGGLQVRHDERWHLVEPLAGALVVNIGDMVQVWSNDRYRAALHRVAASSDRERFSAPFFFNPAYETQCQPLESVVDSDHPPRYRPVNWGDFRKARSDGDYADYGEEIQIAHFRTAEP